MKISWAVLLLCATWLPACADDPAAPEGVLGELPVGAQPWITGEQALDIAANGSLRPASNRGSLQAYEDSRARLQWMYPDVVFEYDASEEIANVHAYEEDGRQVVRVSAGLARQQGIYSEGLFMAMAFGVATLVGGEPRSASGYTVRSMAEYFAYGRISVAAWDARSWSGNTTRALEQWMSLFELVSDSNARGDESGVNPSLPCRRQTIQAALLLYPLPACAGGPRPGPDNVARQ